MLAKGVYRKWKWSKPCKVKFLIAHSCGYATLYIVAQSYDITVEERKIQSSLFVTKLWNTDSWSISVLILHKMCFHTYFEYLEIIYILHYVTYTCIYNYFSISTDNTFQWELTALAMPTPDQ